MEHENLGIDANGEAASGVNHEGESTDAMSSPSAASYAVVRVGNP